MNAKETKLNELQLTLLITGIVGVVFMLLSLIGLAFSQPGWLIGAAIGTGASLLSALLVNISSTATLKGEHAGLFLISYFLRMIIFAGLFAMLAIFQYKLHIDAFTNSLWGMAIAFAPSVLITIIVQAKLNKESK